jgi:hypothetical protein
MGLSAPTTLVSLTDPDELQLLHILYAVCEELRQAKCWAQLKRRHTFTTSASRVKYQLPKDYYAQLLKTHWNETEDERLIGPESDSGMTYLQQSGSSSTTDFTFRIFGGDENPSSEGGQFEIDPTPSPYLWATATAYSVGDKCTSSGGNIYTCTTAITASDTEPSGTTTSADGDGLWTYVEAWAGDALSFEYLGRAFFRPRLWTASTAYTEDTLVSVNDYNYICLANGNSSAADPPSGTGATITDGTTSWAYYDTVLETVVADTDLCVFDDDLVKLGVRAKWMEENGGDYAQAKAEFEAKIDQAVARYKGSFRGNMCRGSPSRYRTLYKIPYKSWDI